MSGPFAPIYEIRQSIPNSVLHGNGWKRTLTHVEIRRVQNGFVVMGFHAAPNIATDEGVEKVAFVCESVESLCALVESLTTDAGGFCWQASVDIPITHLFRTEREGVR